MQFFHDSGRSQHGFLDYDYKKKYEKLSRCYPYPTWSMRSGCDDSGRLTPILPEVCALAVMIVAGWPQSYLEYAL